MRIKADDLLSTILNVSKVNKNLMILNSTEGYQKIKSYASEIYISQYVDILDINLTTSIPVSIIPILSEIKNKIVDVEFNNNRMIIGWGSSIVELNLPHFEIDDIPIDTYQPTFNNKLARLNDVRYSCSNEKEMFDVIFFIETGIITGDRFRFCVYKSTTPLELDGVVISERCLSFLPSDITPSVDRNGNRVYLGDEKCTISVPVIDKPIPQALYQLFELDIGNSPFLYLNTKEVLPQINIANSLSKKDDGFISLISSNGVLSIVPSGNSYGNGVLSVNSSGDFYGEIDVKINPTYLTSAIKNCKTGQIVLGMTELGRTKLLYIIDGELIHYILPMYG